MALSHTSSFDAALGKVNDRPLFLAAIDYTANQGVWTLAQDFQAGSIASDGVGSKSGFYKPGSVICKKGIVDVVTESGYTLETLTLEYGRTLCLRFRSLYPVARDDSGELLNIAFSVKTSSSTSALHAAIVKVKDNLSSVNPTADIDISDAIADVWETEVSGGIGVGTVNEFEVTTSYDDYTLTVISFDFEAFQDYAIVLSPSLDDGNTFTFKSWAPNDRILNGSLLGSNEGGFQIGHAFLTETNYGTGGAFQYDTSADFFDGELFIKTFSIARFVETEYTSGYKDIGATPTANGQFLADYIAPVGSSITFALYWATDTSGTGETLADASIADGDAITTYGGSYRRYYKFVATLTPTSEYLTPELIKVSCYFPTQKTYVDGAETFTLASGGPAFPLIESIPNYDVIVNPFTGASSISETEVVLKSFKVGNNFAQSELEALVNDYYLTDKNITVKIGAEGLSDTADFIAYATGKTSDVHLVSDDKVALVSNDPLLTTSDPYAVDDVAQFSPLYMFWNPIDILLDLISRSGIPQRLINTSSFSTVKSNYFSGWSFYRVFPEAIDDVKVLIDELCLLCGVAVVPLENGQVYCKKLDDTGATSQITFTDDNSDEVGKCKIDLTKRITSCSVQSGFWIEYANIENKETIENTVVEDLEADGRVGKKTFHVANKWIPSSDTTVNGIAQAQLVAQRIVSRFAYGIWTLVRRASLQYSYLQIGDACKVTTSTQILFKGYYGETTSRGVIIGKNVNVEARYIDFTVWLFDHIKARYAFPPEYYPNTMTFSSVTATGITVNWTEDASNDADGYILLQGTGYVPTSKPVDGTSYSAGNTVGDATVVDNISSPTATKAVSGLASDTLYGFTLYPYNGSGSDRVYGIAHVLSGTKRTLDTQPNAATSMVFDSPFDSSTHNVSWTASSGGAEKYIVVRKVGSAPSFSPSDGTDYTSYYNNRNNGSVVASGVSVRYIGSDVNFDDDGLSFSGVAYYYECFAFNGTTGGGENYAAALSGNTTTAVDEPTNQPTNFEAVEADPEDVSLSWTAATPAVYGYVVLRKAGNLMTDVPVDLATYAVGDTVGSSKVAYVGTSTSFNDNGSGALAAPTWGDTFIYKVFAYNDSSGSPGTAENYKTTLAPSVVITLLAEP